jgi:hypothetical protein
MSGMHGFPTIAALKVLASNKLTPLYKRQWKSVKPHNSKGYTVCGNKLRYEALSSTTAPTAGSSTGGGPLGSNHLSKKMIEDLPGVLFSMKE